VSDRYVVLALEEVAGYADPRRARWHMIRSTLGIEAFGVNAWRGTDAGQSLIGEHDELSGGAAAHEELYVVLEGSATFDLDGEKHGAPAGTLVFVKDPAVRRSAVADEAGTVVLVVGAKPGEAFSVSPWERADEALRYWPTGEWDKAIAILEAQLAETPDDANVLYNLACAEAQGGRSDDALAHLASAIEKRSEYREQAQEDPDFDPIREAAGFPSPPAS
jgi:tetratricopeptide (TPR) repeat protein